MNRNPPVLRWLWPFLSACGIALFLLIYFISRAWNADQVFVGDAVYFIDPDCYSRMTRVQMVMEQPGARIERHDFENWPEGIATHTTSPMDYAIVGLALLFGRVDLAGAWISPLLGVGLVGWLWWWAGRLKLSAKWPMLILVGFSPMLAHAFCLGRPDHQSLTICGIALGLTCGLARWRDTWRGWQVGWGLGWGLALWVSLFEPLVLFLICLLAEGLRSRIHRAAFFRENRTGWITLGCVVLFAVIFDGVRLSAPNPEVALYFPRWAEQIGELRALPVFSSQWFGWCGWLLPVLPLALLANWNQSRRDMTPLFLLALLLILFALTCWHIRWGYFLVLVSALAFCWAWPGKRNFTWIAYPLFVVSLWPVAAEWETRWFPSEAVSTHRAENRQESILLRETGLELAKYPEGAVMAPWWCAPALVYWSGKPNVTGSSHQSLPGIADSARFYLATTPEEATALLKKRNVRYVIGYEPDRILSTAAALLDQPIRPHSLAEQLFKADTPPYFRLNYANAFFRIYEYHP